jgi:hypothetical protein
VAQAAMPQDIVNQAPYLSNILKILCYTWTVEWQVHKQCKIDSSGNHILDKTLAYSSSSANYQPEKLDVPITIEMMQS